MVFPHFEIEEIKKLDGRDLTRFDLDFDIPEHFLPAFPPAIYLTTRPDLGMFLRENFLRSITTTGYSTAFLIPSSWKVCACC